MLSVNEEVFHIYGTYTYEEAKFIAKMLKCDLASWSQMMRAYQNGANWCNYGWSKDQQAYYPIQQAYYDNLKKQGKESNCGKPGLNGGYFRDTKLEFGINCYGIKPNFDLDLRRQGIDFILSHAIIQNVGGNNNDNGNGIPKCEPDIDKSSNATSNVGSDSYNGSILGSEYNSIEESNANINANTDNSLSMSWDNSYFGNTSNNNVSMYMSEMASMSYSNSMSAATSAENESNSFGITSTSQSTSGSGSIGSNSFGITSTSQSTSGSGSIGSGSFSTTSTSQSTSGSGSIGSGSFSTTSTSQSTSGSGSIGSNSFASGSLYLTSETENTIEVKLVLQSENRDCSITNRTLTVTDSDGNTIVEYTCTSGWNHTYYVHLPIGDKYHIKIVSEYPIYTSTLKVSYTQLDGSDYSKTIYDENTPSVTIDLREACDDSSACNTGSKADCVFPVDLHGDSQYNCDGSWTGPYCDPVDNASACNTGSKADCVFQSIYMEILNIIVMVHGQDHIAVMQVHVILVQKQIVNFQSIYMEILNIIFINGSWTGPYCGNASACNTGSKADCVFPVDLHGDSQYNCDGSWTGPYCDPDDNPTACNKGSRADCVFPDNDRVDCDGNPLYCTDPNACNYDGSNGSCIYHGSSYDCQDRPLYCTDSAACNTGSKADCVFPVDFHMEILNIIVMVHGQDHIAVCKCM